MLLQLQYSAPLAEAARTSSTLSGSLRQGDPRRPVQQTVMIAVTQPAFALRKVQDEKLLEMVVSRVEKTADRQRTYHIHISQHCCCGSMVRRFKMLELCNAAWGISKMSFPVDKIDKGMQAGLSIPI